MPKKHSCPLCRGEKNKFIEKISLDNLSFLYEKQLGSSARPLFTKSVFNYLKLLKCGRCGLKYFQPSLRSSRQIDYLLETKDWYFLDNKEEFIQAIENITPKSNVLEIGAGNGNFASKLASRYYRGLEKSRSAREIASSKGIKLLGESLFEHSKKNKNVYDAICMFQVLEHISNPNAFLISALRCLKPNGKLIISIPNDDSFVGVALNHELNFPPVHKTRWNREVFDFIAKKFGLNIEKLYLEKLRDEHLEWYLETLFVNNLNILLKRKSRLIDLSWQANILVKVAKIFARFLAKGISLKNMRPTGASLTVVMGKN